MPWVCDYSLKMMRTIDDLSLSELIEWVKNRERKGWPELVVTRIGQERTVHMEDHGAEQAESQGAPVAEPL